MNFLAEYKPHQLVGVTLLADGADQLFAEAVLSLSGRLEVIVPAERYRDGLPADYHATYDHLLNKASKVRRLPYVESTKEAHMAGSTAMLDTIDHIVAVWDGQPARGHGGTRTRAHRYQQRSSWQLPENAACQRPPRCKASTGVSAMRQASLVQSRRTSEAHDSSITLRPVLVLVTGLQGSGKSTIADGCAGALDAAVLAWDWSMAALTPYSGLQKALRRMDRDTYRSVGWALMWQIARAQLQRGASVVLDGMARSKEVAETRQLAADFSTKCLVVVTACDDTAVQRARIEGRQRGIPGWHELSWDHVNQAREVWQPPSDVDLILDTTQSLENNLAQIYRLLQP
jgi:predicted kinase